MNEVPRAGGLDSTAALLRDGYAFIGNRCRDLGTDVFETRLLGQRTICVTGAEAARAFYDPQRMTRHGAMPGWIKYLLLGRGGVQGLDGDAHGHRKALFMEMMSPDRVEKMSTLTAEGLRRAARGWQERDHVVLLDETQEVLCRAVCAWAGVPLDADEVPKRTREMDSIVAGSAAVSWRHLQAWQARRQSEAWAADLVRQVRDNRLRVPDDAPLARVAWYRKPDGDLLDYRVAGVELLNILRPTVAVATYIVFAALALHEHAEARKAIEQHGDPAVESFVQEVRRYYPFFPFAAARVGQAFQWQEVRFPAGRRVLLDLYGTNHDDRLWERPEVFVTARFVNREPGAYDLIPQGGGSHDVNHRCAGEWITMAVMKAGVRFLVHELEYSVPEQDLRVPLDRFPTQPNSRFLIHTAGLASTA